MNTWRPTASLGRSLLVGAIGVGLAVLFGDPVLVVLVAPMLLLAALGLLNRPASTPRIEVRLDHVNLHEGQGTRSRLLIDDTTDVEYVTRVAAHAPYVAMHPASGHLGVLLREGEEPPTLEVSPRRWGVRILGEEKVGLTGPWAGYRWGPVLLPGRSMWVLPSTTPFDSKAEAPHPIGLVGRHRSRRPGDGTEFASIRPFHAGDRLRRINWRVSLRSDVAARGDHPGGAGHRRAARGRRPGRPRTVGRDRRRVEQPGRHGPGSDRHRRAPRAHGRPGLAARDRRRPGSASATAPEPAT